MRTVRGDLSGKGQRLAIVVSAFNEPVTSRLLAGAVDALTRHGVEEDHIDVFKVPGSFEIPMAAGMVASSKRYDAVVCLGAVIKGETPHHEHLAREVIRGIGQVAQTEGLPVVLGVLTTDTVEQAMARAGLKEGNKGWEAAVSALEMVNLCRQIVAMG